MCDTPSSRKSKGAKQPPTTKISINLAAGQENVKLTNNKVPSSPFNKENFISRITADYEAGGLSMSNIENMQINSLHQENKRERLMNESLQKDVEMLREQLGRAEEIRMKQETVISEANSQISYINSNFQKQLNDKELTHQKHLNEKETSY